VNCDGAQRCAVLFTKQNPTQNQEYMCSLTTANSLLARPLQMLALLCLKVVYPGNRTHSRSSPLLSTTLIAPVNARERYPLLSLGDRTGRAVRGTADSVPIIR
jgi:hypothetical protein